MNEPAGYCTTAESFTKAWVSAKRRHTRGLANVSYLFKELCKQYDTTPEAIRHPSRLASLVKKRHAIMYCLYEQDVSLKIIGKELNRHHTTVLHGIRAYKDSLLRSMANDI